MPSLGVSLRDHEPEATFFGEAVHVEQRLRAVDMAPVTIHPYGVDDSSSLHSARRIQGDWSSADKAWVNPDLATQAHRHL
jgi:hypothetical protein